MCFVGLCLKELENYYQTVGIIELNDDYKRLFPLVSIENGGYVASSCISDEILSTEEFENESEDDGCDGEDGDEEEGYYSGSERSSENGVEEVESFPEKIIMNQYQQHREGHSMICRRRTIDEKEESEGGMTNTP